MRGRNRFFVPSFDEQIVPRLEIGDCQTHSASNEQAPLASHQHLLITHPAIQSRLPNQFLMGSHLHNPPLVQHNNFICRRNGGQAERDNEGGFAVGFLE